MKNRIIRLLPVLLVFASCARDYNAPPLTEPTYDGKAANMTIAKLKSLYADITDPKLIDSDYIINAYVTGNDISGNIYKQLYIQDESGGINMGIDQNSIYTLFRTGQEIYVHLKGLYMVKYGGQLQIGYGDTNANRIPWEVFNYYTFRHKWPKEENVSPKLIKLSEKDESMVNMLVKLENVYFLDGGKVLFSESDATTNRTLKDFDGNSIIVRNSNYANFAADSLPKGAGTVVGILSKYNNDWQLYLRTKDDCINLTQPIPGDDDDDGDLTTFYSETFENVTPERTKFNSTGDAMTGFDFTAGSYTGTGADVRSTSQLNKHIWFPAHNASFEDARVKVSNIPSGYKDIKLTYDVAANADNVPVNGLMIKANDAAVTLPNTVLATANSYLSVSVDLSMEDVTTLEFYTDDTNASGYRLDNIKLQGIKK